MIQRSAARKALGILCLSVGMAFAGGVYAADDDGSMHVADPAQVLHSDQEVAPSGWRRVLNIFRGRHRESRTGATSKTGAPSRPGTQKISAAYPTGRPSTSILLVQNTAPSVVRVGQPATYTIEVTNLTDQTLSDVAVAETAPANAQFKINQSEPAYQRRGEQLVWPLGSLAGNESKTIRFEAAAGTVGELPCCTTVTYSTPPLCMKTSVIKPAVELTLEAPPDALLCDPVPIKFVVSNTGVGDVTGLNIKSLLPPGVVGLNGGNKVNIDVDGLTEGESRHFVAKVKAGTPGPFVTRASASGDGVAAEAAPVTTRVHQPKLEVAITGPTNVYLGRKMELDISIGNAGDATAERTLVQAALPPGTRFVGATDDGRLEGDKVIWDVGGLQPGAKKQLNLTLKAEGEGAAQFEAAAQAYCSAEAKGFGLAELRGIAAILLEVVDVEDPVGVGEVATYDIKVANQGSAPGTNIRVTAKLESMDGVAATGATEGTIEGNNVTFAPLPSLPVGETATWKVQARGKEAGDFRFHVRLTSDQLMRPVEESESTRVY